MTNVPQNIVNPILPGFNPDPSICRVGEDYYIATSTFEWFPGVQIHHSKDLGNWRLLTRPLTRPEQLDMRGNPDSCGIWAPCLTHADGVFWLVYTDVKRHDGSFKDAHNYLVTAPEIEGPWSDPVYVNSTGFDPSLFHDDDGRKWFLNMIWDYRVGYHSFQGIQLQEYDPVAKSLTGPARNIFKGTELGLTEAPHLYKRDGWYYLLTAEGGTAYGHAATLARARRIGGPYELHPDKHVVTSRFFPDNPIQRAGHGDLVETQNGETYLVHLMGRPRPGQNRCQMGRETAIQKCVWGEDGWLRLATGGMEPQSEVSGPDLPSHPFAQEPDRYDFDGPDLPLPFQWLRTPYPERLYSLSERPGHLRLFGREYVGSFFEQALVARRQTDYDFEAETRVEFQPVSIQQAAGLIAYYGRYQFFFLAVTLHEQLGRVLTILSCPGDYPGGFLEAPLDRPVSLPDRGAVAMKVTVEDMALRFFYRVEGLEDWQRIGPVFDATILADESGRGPHSNFTGAFVGMHAMDGSGAGQPADFDYFGYRNFT
ncbi:glycoside hydrolase family 43 protein [Roseibium aggregatum]|uniref:Glycoside hydrolase family 43 protein n=1 Tax=Roseibium aggregatum TaxID=187304 RepID=A0A939E9R1_9HYPH|nr:glycoside hydrolase family 43 protein [Roseibium aggregatum]MBN9668928.1 glycoside hydrolase family 43 protein [Roseibium aggregatum]